MSIIVFCLIIGFIIGIIAGWFMYRPDKSWDNGWEAAKEHYADWDDGFNKGWVACKRYMEKEAVEDDQRRKIESHDGRGNC